MGDNTKYGPGREFVRAQPVTISNRDVALAATAAGIPMTTKQAQQWRYLIRKEKTGTKSRPKRIKAIVSAQQAHAALVLSPQQAAVVPPPVLRRAFTPGPIDDKEIQLRQLLFELGYDRVALILEEYIRLVRGDQ